jgi:hypothetical protein
MQIRGSGSKYSSTNKVEAKYKKVLSILEKKSKKITKIQVTET